MGLAAKFCPACGKPTTTTQTEASSVISKDRKTIAYMLGFFIAGFGHFAIKKPARGITFFIIAIIIGLVLNRSLELATLYGTNVGWWIFILVMIGIAISWWLIQLFDLHHLIKYGKGLV